MSQASNTFPPNPSDSGEDSSSRSGLLWWLVALCTAVVLHLLIGYALFVAALPCAQAAWKSFRCGFWLRRADPVAARGRACWWFSMAVGCWKAAATAFVLVLVLFAIGVWRDKQLDAQRQGRRPGPEEQAIRDRMEREVISASLIVPTGACLCTLIGMVSIVVALRGKVRVWAHPSLRQRCHGDFNRLRDYARPRRSSPNRPINDVAALRALGPFNHVIFVVAISLLLVPACLGTGYMMWYGYNHPKDAQNMPLAIGFSLVFGGPLAMIPVYAFLSSRIIARVPAECWPPTDVIAPASSCTSTPGPDAPRR